MSGPHIKDLGTDRRGKRGITMPRIPTPAGRALAAIAAVLVVGALLIWLLVSIVSGGSGGADGDEAGAIIPESAEPEAAAEPEPECIADPDDDTSPIGVIHAMEHAYYVERDGAAVVDHVASGDAQQVQEGIDSIPEGTDYCLSVNQVSEGDFMVDVTEHRPDGETVKYSQRMRVEDGEDGAVIQSIEQAGNGV